MVKKETTVDKTSTADNRTQDVDAKRPTVVKPAEKPDQKPEKPSKKVVDRDYTKNVPKPEPKRDAVRKKDKPNQQAPVASKPPPPPPPRPADPTTVTGGVAPTAPAPDSEDAPKKAKKGRYDEDSRDKGGDDEERDFAQKVSPRVSATGSYDSGEVMTIGQAGRRKWRLAASFAGGFARSGGESVSLLSTGARLEFTVAPRVLTGIDASLWLLDGEVVTGQGLVSFAVIGLKRWVELGFGVGLQFGELGAGPATGISLRFHLPPKPRAALFLRYDGALIYDNNARRGQSSATGGIEWSF
jgi:hypothetical protein